MDLKRGPRAMGLDHNDRASRTEDHTGVAHGVSAEILTLSDQPKAGQEAIRALAAQIIAQQIEPGRRGVAICGTSSGVGVTFVGANLAVALAEAGVSTLLLDANLRAPRVQDLIVPTQELPGLQQHLRGDRADWADIVQDDVLPNLSIIYAGGSSADASELISGIAFKALVQRCLRDFDFTVVDAPPANASADARIISAAVGYSLIVARRDVSFVDDIATFAKQLQEDGSIVVGALLNGN